REEIKMESSLSRLLVGLSVQISRSDGRVHLATVKSVDAVKSTVMVEWNERNICRGKEVEVSELCTLNPELLDHINAVTNKAAEQPPPAPDKKYEGRLRSSRIPAPASSSVPAVTRAEESGRQGMHAPLSKQMIGSRSQGRQTCMFQVPAPVPPPAESLQANPETIHPDLPPSSVLTNSGISNQQRRKNEAKPAKSLVHEAIKENDEPEKMPPPPPQVKGRRKSVAPQELNKANKRLSCVVKPPDVQTKRGKFGEPSRPNQKFYDMIQDFRETLEITPLSATDHIEPQRICVCVRKRPLNKQEINRKEIDVVSVPGKGALLVHEPKQKVDLTKYLDNQNFHFDYSFDDTATNELVYKFTAKPLVQSIFEGGMATCFAYGQTGSGKTHTMGGDFTGRQQNSSKGIYALAAQDVFAYLNHRRYNNLDLSAYVSFFEIYNGKVYDLLNKKAKLRVLEDDRQQVQVVGLEEVYVSTADDVIKMIQMGSACRTSGQTSANANSSRSHAILQIVLRRNDRATTLHGKFSLVDLAGNERGTDVSSNDRSTLVETAEINRSLLALKECIRSLGKNSDHIPFRMSTLTKVLRDSFIGEKSRTCMIAMVSPGMASCEYTMNTLRYADRKHFLIFGRVKELNGNSTASGAAKTNEPINSSTEEESVEDTSVYDAINQVAELEEKVYVEFKRANEFIKAMEQTSYNIEEGLPEMVDHSRKLLGLYKPQCHFGFLSISSTIYSKINGTALLSGSTEETSPGTNGHEVGTALAPRPGPLLAVLRHVRRQQRRCEEDEDAVCDGTPPQVSDLVSGNLARYKRVFEEYTQALYQRYPDIRIEGENYLPIPLYRHVASFLSMFKLLLIGVIIIGRDPFAPFGMQAPGIWEWGQGNKIYACMMVFFLSNMIENQLMSTGAFEITLNGESVIHSMAPVSVGIRLISVVAPLRTLVRSSMVQTRVGSPALHAAACANPGQRDEDERSHEHKTTPLLTLLYTSWLELKAPPCATDEERSIRPPVAASDWLSRHLTYRLDSNSLCGASSHSSVFGTHDRMTHKGKRRRVSGRWVAAFILACCLVQAMDCQRLKKTERQEVRRESGTAKVRGVQEGRIVFGRALNRGSGPESVAAEGAKKSSNVSVEEDASYQADFAGWAKGQTQDTSSKEAMWKRMAPSLQCGEDQLRFRAVGPGASQFAVEQGNAPPMDLSQVPSTCGYSMHRNSLALIMLVPFDGCNIVQETGSYVLQMRWKGIPVSLWCPKPAVPTPITAAPQNPVLQTPGYPPSYAQMPQGNNPDLVPEQTTTTAAKKPDVLQFPLHPFDPYFPPPPPVTTAVPTTTDSTTTTITKKPDVLQFPQYPLFHPFYPYLPPPPPVTTAAPTKTVTKNRDVPKFPQYPFFYPFYPYLPPPPPVTTAAPTTTDSTTTTITKKPDVLQFPQYPLFPSFLSLPSSPTSSHNSSANYHRLYYHNHHKETRCASISTIPSLPSFLSLPSSPTSSHNSSANYHRLFYYHNHHKETR
ncbi:hypothetical protein L3Q82_021495, partial [Scortum barcoo]